MQRPTHFISAGILRAGGQLVGMGQMDINWPDGVPITSMADVTRLGEFLTEEGHRRALLPADCRYAVLSWSEYGNAAP